MHKLHHHFSTRVFFTCPLRNILINVFLFCYSLQLKPCLL